MKRTILAQTLIIWVFLLTTGQTVDVELKAFLEGPFSGTAMTTSLNSSNYLPLNQPYHTAPWNYQGTESVPLIPNADVVDWVLVELRETAGDASTAYTETVVGRQAGFLLKDGAITGLDGISPLQFNLSVSQKLYAVIYHRNHLPVLSGNELVDNGGLYVFDFTSGASQAYGGITAHKELVPGIWGMASGDGNADSQVNNADKNDVWKPQAGSSGYLSGDYSMNGQVDNGDKIELWSVNSGRSAQFPGSWSCGKVMADPRDGQMYSTVEIGTQCWMAENLNIGTAIDGTLQQSDNGIIEKYCYGNSTANCDEYGGLYQWNEMMQYGTGAQGICPDGWHLPTDDEWCTLEQFVDPTITCSSTGWRGVDGGGKLKETGTAHWASPNTGATNSSEFTALPGGYRGINGDFIGLTGLGDWWSASGSSFNAWYRGLGFNLSQVFRSLDDKSYGFSVRCLLGDPASNQPPNPPSDPNPPDNATGQPVSTQLSWTCSDPENDPLTYDVFFGTDNPPATQISIGQTGTAYDPGTLDYSTTYY